MSKLVSSVRSLLGVVSRHRRKTIVGSLLFGFLGYKWHSSRLMELTYVKTQENEFILENLRHTISQYSPTFFMPHDYLGLLLSNRFIHETADPYERQLISLKDGETISIDWFPKGHDSKLEGDVPVIVLVPGITSDSTAEYALTFCEYAFRDYGFRIGVLNRRGYSGMEYTKDDPDPITWNKFEDMDEVLDTVSNKYPDSHLYLAGISMGANHIQKYAGLRGLAGKGIKAKALGCISSPYCLISASENINASSIFRPSITSGLVRSVQSHLHEEKFVKAAEKRGIDLKQVLASQSSDEFNQNFSIKFSNHDTLDEYKSSVSSKDAVEHIKVPTLAVNSRTDGIAHHTAIPYESIRNNPRFIQLLVNSGGHIEYFSTFFMRRWAYDLVLDYFTLLHKQAKPASMKPKNSSSK